MSGFCSHTLGEKICYPPKNIYHSAWHEQNCGLVKNFPSSEMQKQKIENLGNRQKAESGVWTKGGERGRERTISCSLSYWALGQAKQAPPYLQGPREDAAPRHRPSLLLLSPRRLRDGISDHGRNFTPVSCPRNNIRRSHKHPAMEVPWRQEACLYVGNVA